MEVAASALSDLTVQCPSDACFCWNPVGLGLRTIESRLTIIADRSFTRYLNSFALQSPAEVLHRRTKWAMMSPGKVDDRSHLDAARGLVNPADGGNVR
jgi:hypothetical protein